MAIEGAIAERARSIIPITWDALVNDPRYGESLLLYAIDVVKQNVFGEIVTEEEESLYPLIAIDYAAKLVAIELCLPGIDFWMNEPLSESATGTNENHVFTERVQSLKDLRKELIIETRRLSGDIANLVGYARPTRRRPESNTIDLIFLTPDPIREFPRPYKESDFS